MFTKVITPSDDIDVLGLLQAWSGVHAVFARRADALSAMLDRDNGEFIQKIWFGKIGDFDGGMAMIYSQSDIYIFVGPASGLEDYATWAVLGVPAYASSLSNAWANSRWQDFNGPIVDAIRAELAIISQPGRTVQIVGFSQGGAQAVLIGRALSQQVNGYVVRSVGFGMPRPIGNSFIAPQNEKVVRLVNGGDPVDLVPPTSLIVPQGGPLTGMPIPTAWENYGTRFVMSFAGINPQADPPSPPDSILLAELVQNINLHTAGSYDQMVSYQFVNGGAPGGIVGGQFMAILRAINSGVPVGFSGPQKTQTPQLAPPVVAPPPPPGPQQQWLIQEMITPVPPGPDQQFLIQQFPVGNGTVPPSLTRDPG